jgi:hypothetical protein
MQLLDLYFILTQRHVLSLKGRLVRNARVIS